MSGELSHLEDRVRTLEASARRWRRGTLAAGVLVVGVLALGQASGPAESLRAKQFVLVDDAGVERARLKVADASFGRTAERPRVREARLAFVSEDGVDVVELGPGQLELRDPSGNGRLSLRVVPYGGYWPQVLLTNGGQVGANLSVQTRPNLELFDPAGKRTRSITIDSP